MKVPIKEALNVDLEVVSRELTEKETESLKGTSKNPIPASSGLRPDLRQASSFGHPAFFLSQLPTGSFLRSGLGWPNDDCLCHPFGVLRGSLKEFLRQNRMALPRKDVRTTRASMRRKVEQASQTAGILIAWRSPTEHMAPVEFQVLGLWTCGVGG